MAQYKDDSEFAPAMDSDPVFERPAEGRWDIAQLPDAFGALEGPGSSGAWADGRSLYDIPELAGPTFVDPGTFALVSHMSPDFRTSSFSSGAIQNASADLDAPIFGGGGGGGGGDDKNKNKGGGSLF